LLEVKTLARIISSHKQGVFDDIDGNRIVELMLEAGFSRPEADNALQVICEAADSLVQHHNGKVQHYLRHYGERMLDEALAAFRFTTLDEGAAKYAFTYWLQNVLNMPLSLRDVSVLSFCRQYGLTVDDLIAAADELDLNLALLDDLILGHVASHDSSQSTADVEKRQ
jgi:hypothetical protein